MRIFNAKQKIVYKFDFFRVTTKRDANQEVPANFSEFVNLWSLESIACITLDKRLGLTSENEKNQDKDAKELIKVCFNYLK